MSEPIPDVFSTHSAARFCRVTPMTIIRWIEEDRIRAYKTPGGHRRIMRADLESFCRESGIPMQWEDRIEVGAAKRVLIVERDAATIEAILDAVCDEENGEEETSGFEVQHTHTAFDAGMMVATLRPHVVFVNVAIPGLDAQAIAKSIKSEPTLAKTRVVAIVAGGGSAPPTFDEVLSTPIAKPDVRRVTGPLPRLNRD